MLELSARPPAVDGSFYPAHPAELSNTVTDLLDRAPDVSLPGRIVGLVSPHAGYVYSGQVAATAYRPLRGARYDAVVIVAPSHRESVVGLSIYNGAAYHTPLGPVPVDRAFADALADELDTSCTDTGHRTDHASELRGEHAIEVQLPFLQTVLDDFSFIPVLVGNPESSPWKALGRAIARVSRRLAPNTLVIASSDLYHGHDAIDCSRSDDTTLGLIEAYDADALIHEIETLGAAACGAVGVAATIVATRALGATSGFTVANTNSNRVSGRTGGYVVGYGAVVFCRPHAGTVSDADRQTLVDIAKTAVFEAAQGRPNPPLEHVSSEILASPRGAFVTLRLHGNLRGCIGDVHGADSLAETVRTMAYRAATSDPRFPPLSLDEAEDISIELSILSPLSPLPRIEDIEIGHHGLFISVRNQHGVLLPQVPVDRGWDQRQFVEALCQKCGLPADAHEDPDARIWSFTADSVATP